MSEQKAAELRREFDQGFAEGPAVRETDRERILLLASAGERVAVRLSQITGLLKMGRVTPIRSRAPELLGLTGIRGALVPVFDAAPLLEIPRSAARAEWLVVAGGKGMPVVALAFDEVGGQADISASAAGPGDRQVLVGTAMYRLVEVPPVLHRLRTISERGRDLL